MCFYGEIAKIIPKLSSNTLLICFTAVNVFDSYFQAKGINLSCVRTCCVIAEERPRIHLTTSFTKLFANLGLSTRAVSTSFGCRVNVGISFPVSHSVTSFTYLSANAVKQMRWVYKVGNLAGIFLLTYPGLLKVCIFPNFDEKFPIWETEKEISLIRRCIFIKIA